MKQTWPLPEASELAGDPEPAPIKVGPNPEPKQTSLLLPPDESTRPPLNATVETMKRLSREGKHKRAVVCHHLTNPLDPMNWGVVVDVQAMRRHPIEIIWLKGPRQWSDGKELIVIYRSMPQNAMAQFLKENKPSEAH